MDNEAFSDIYLYMFSFTVFWYQNSLPDIRTHILKHSVYIKMNLNDLVPVLDDPGQNESCVINFLIKKGLNITQLFPIN